MKTLTKSLGVAAILAAAFATNALAQTTTVYDTSVITPTVTQLQQLQTSTSSSSSEIGNEVYLSGGASHLSSMTFGYYARNFTGGEGVTLNLYAHDGPLLPNTTPFFTDGGPFTFVNGEAAGTVNTVIFDVDQVVPQHFTWTLTFTDLADSAYGGLWKTDAGYTVGGGIDNGAWLKNGSSWDWLTSQSAGDLSPLFVAQFVGTTVPEPSTLALLGFGGVALLGLRRRKS